MFDSWLEQEKAAIRSRYEKIRIFGIVIAVFMASSILTQAAFLLDGGGWGSLIFMIIYALILFFALFWSDYKRRFIKPLLASVRQELPTKEKQEAFARQMKEHAVSISYHPLPGLKACTFMVSEEYGYARQPGKSRIICSHRLHRIAYTREEYTSGRGHMRWCYGLALYAAGDEKPLWTGYFMRQEEAEQALSILQNVLPPEIVVQDEVSNPEEKPLWKTLWELAPIFIFAAILVFIGKRFTG